MAYLDKNNPELHGDFIFSFDRNGTWKVALKSPGQKQQIGQSQLLQIRYDKLSLQSDPPFLDVQGQGTAAAHDIRLSFTIPKVQANYDGVEMSMPEAYLLASYLQEEGLNRGRASRSNINLRLVGTRFQKKGLSGRANISLQGEIGSIKKILRSSVIIHEVISHMPPVNIRTGIPVRITHKSYRNAQE